MRERYIFTGTLICKAGLHVGSGKGAAYTDATVMTDPDGNPFIPGSSLKGAMRSAVERIGQVLNHTGKFTSCLLFEENNHVQCVTSNESLRQQYEEMREQGASEEELVGFLLGDPPHLCDTCKVFGSPYYASKVRITDAHWVNGHNPVVRDGVGIDRDTETAAENIKFDFEVVPPDAEFKFEMILEDPDGKDLGLVCLALREMELDGLLSISTVVSSVCRYLLFITITNRKKLFLGHYQVTMFFTVVLKDSGFNNRIYRT